MTIHIKFKPTSYESNNPHVIGLAILAKLNLLLTVDTYKLKVSLVEDSHVNKTAIDKQMNDKERVIAMFEKPEIWLGLLQYLNLPDLLEVALVQSTDSRTPRNLGHVSNESSNPGA